jgi:redox-sensitive bicupin YhaK (pirin superfamily)
MKTRTLSQLEKATVEMVGANKVLQALPTRNLKQVDPFLLIHHLVPVDVQSGASIRIPPHPHAGFEVVTYLLDGEFFHRDSLGNDQIAKGGDINWMTSGSGIIHSEGPTENFLKQGGRLQLLQIWINLPAKDKFLAPGFRHYDSSSFPVLDNGEAWLKVLIGKYKNLQADPIHQTPMFAYHLKLKKGMSFVLDVDQRQTSAVYLMQGKVDIQDEVLKSGQLGNFNLDGDQLEFLAEEDSELFIFGGLPIKEKVVSYGPFVMNSFEDIQKSITNYEKGKMGQLSY